jgi:hypothetical protein
MHFEVLVEDISDGKTLEIIVPKIISNEHTYRIFAYKGIGRIPKNCTSGSEARKRLLLNNLPRLAKQITPFMDINNNASLSFQYFRLTLQEFLNS